MTASKMKEASVKKTLFAWSGGKDNALALSELKKDPGYSNDPCGENGEFHSFVFNGPGFPRPVGFKKGRAELREKRFYFCDLPPMD